ncbi:hypothetical protein HN588_12320 [Candidatus Bathyarchaeota archaeon]|jgi:hypothetical protein|nr:hypothetical protein [Candidatus Bathyarchaeota archaeon]
MQMAELVDKIVAKRAERGFVTDPLKIYVLLTEEVGEIAAEGLLGPSLFSYLDASEG